MNWKVLVLSLFFAACASAEIDIDAVDQALRADGIAGEVHGANHDNGYYVFTVRGNNFFDYVHFSLYSRDPKVQTVLKGLKRHDYIKVKGAISDKTRPQKHISASDVTVVKSWDVQLRERVQDMKIPASLQGKTEFIGKVHALVEGGQVLVLEYGDAIIPVPVEASLTHATQDLSRGDKVRVHFSVRSYPKGPAHIVLDSQKSTPVEVLESVQSQHGKVMEITGALVLFPKSPQVMFDVFALQADLGDGVVRDYTLVNFENIQLFKDIRAKADLAWKAAPQDGIFNGRNKLVNSKLIGKAKGVINYVDPNQANPQVLLERIEDLQFSY